MKGLYSPEKHVQILVALLKEYGIKNIIASPGATNVSFVASLQYDPYFSIVSAPDERSAAYMACGMAEETGEPVVITCTGATSSRNYMPGLTEAYYRKLPVVAITASTYYSNAGHLRPQFMDRSQQPNDLVMRSVQLPEVKDRNSELECMIKINQALYASLRRGGGPVHINYITTYPRFDDYINELPTVKRILYYTSDSIQEVRLPAGKVAIFVGSHNKMSKELTQAIDEFCKNNNAVVFCDHTSGYYGLYKVLYPLAASQNMQDANMAPDLLIHIGEVSGDYYTTGKLKLGAKRVWRVSLDGEIRVAFGKLDAIFEMSELTFFRAFHGVNVNSSYLESCNKTLCDLRVGIEDLPFSNIWTASILSSRLPKNSVLHLGILNSLRAWNFFEIDNSITVYSNVGGFGIDGGMSTMLGGSIQSPEKLFFGVFGDLAFFYDMNCLGNRYVHNNLRILLINNGRGTEFRNYSHSAYPLGNDADLFVAAAGHYGNKSELLVRHYAEDLGFKYLTAHNKDEFLACIDEFTTSKVQTSIVFEVFTESNEESDALKSIRTIKTDAHSTIVSVAKKTALRILSKDVISKIKK